MRTAGPNLYPCGHHRARLPQESGTVLRACHVCHARFALHIEPSARLTQKCGAPVLWARWEPLTKAAV